MPAFSLDRDAIFTRTAPVPLSYQDFPDFYALLAIETDASPTEVETAIVERGADLLAASFSRRGGNELMRLIERHLQDFRPILLDADNRRRYDDQLARHKRSDANALPFADWRARLPAPKPPIPPARGLKARLRRALWGKRVFLSGRSWELEVGNYHRTFGPLPILPLAFPTPDFQLPTSNNG